MFPELPASSLGKKKVRGFGGLYHESDNWLLRGEWHGRMRDVYISGLVNELPS